jgi:hypothetical protein
MPVVPNFEKKNNNGSVYRGRKLCIERNSKSRLYQQIICEKMRSDSTKQADKFTVELPLDV